jgi:P2 family phage contractile tail tube protein
MANVPERLVNFEVYAGGTACFLGKATVDLPSFEPLTETISGAGIAGEYNSPVTGHFGSQTVKFAFRTVNKDQLSRLAPVYQAFDIRGAIQVQDPMRGILLMQPLIVECRGQTKNLTLGKLEPGKVMGSEFELEISRITISLDGIQQVELDKFNNVFRVNGVDYLADVRRALGGV